MKLEEMFWHELERKMAEEAVKKLSETDGREGIRKTDLELYLRDALGTTYVFGCTEWVVGRLRDQGYVQRKRFTLKDYEEDGSREIPRYYLTRKGKRLYRKLC